MNEISIKQGTQIRYYKGNITPGEKTIFVFGSNPEGRHGAGAAKTACLYFGAIYGQGEGLQGHAYALPTKDIRVRENNGYRSVSTQQITRSISMLYCCAFCHPELNFFIAYRNVETMSLNGYSGIEMMRMFNEAGVRPNNIIFSEEWSNSGCLSTR